MSANKIIMHRRRLLPYCFLFLSAFVAKGQDVELLGKYSSSRFGYEIIEFVGKDSFYFSGYYCGLIARGKGRCEIRGNYLYLFYQKSTDEERDRSTSAVIDRKQDAGDKAVIDISCLFADTLPLVAASIEVKSAGHTIPINLTDDAGNLKLVIPADHFPIVIKSTVVGVLPGEITLSQPADYSVRFFHREYAGEEIKDKVEVYEISELSEDMIVMRQRRTTPFVKYERHSN